jgi:DNA polymerase-3 subunit gamma/tau
MLLKGLEEASRAPNPAAAAEMLLIRLCYTADLPSPEDIVRRLGGAPLRSPDAAKAPLPSSQPIGQPLNQAPVAIESQAAPATRSGAADEESGFPPAPPVDIYDQEPASRPDEDDEDLLADIGPSLSLAQLRTFPDVVALASAQRDAKLKVHLEEHVSLVRFDPAGSIELHLLAGAPKELPNDLREKLNRWTGRQWMVAVSRSMGALPIGEALRQSHQAEIAALRKHPAVTAIFEHFPDAEITSVQPLLRGSLDETGTE